MRLRIPREVRGRYLDFFHRPYWTWLGRLDERLHGWHERELIATAVSQANLSRVCVAGHRPRAVVRLSEDEVGRALDVAQRGSLPPIRRALLDFAEQLTLTPEDVSPGQVERAVEAGVSAERLRDVVEIAALMNVMNRIYVTLDVPHRS